MYDHLCCFVLYIPTFNSNAKITRRELPSSLFTFQVFIFLFCETYIWGMHYYYAPFSRANELLSDIIIYVYGEKYEKKSSSGTRRCSSYNRDIILVVEKYFCKIIFFFLYFHFSQATAKYIVIIFIPVKALKFLSNADH